MKFLLLIVLGTLTLPVTIFAAPQDVPIQALLEARLEIPVIGVSAVVKDMGLTPAGAMAVPDNQIDSGWYSFGTRPGEVGSAVIGGHNTFARGPGVFSRLNELQVGDLLSVVDATGTTTSFIVRDIKTFNALDTNTGIFESETGTHLNLITCSGVWNPFTQSYTTRLVVFTDRVVHPTAIKIIMAGI